MTIVHNSRPTKIHWRAAHGQDHGQLIDKCGKVIAQWKASNTYQQPAHSLAHKLSSCVSRSLDSYTQSSHITCSQPLMLEPTTANHLRLTHTRTAA